MDNLIIQSKVFGPFKNPNGKFAFVQLVKLLILFPFFSEKNAADYSNSGFGKLFSCKKDTFCILGFKVMFLCYTDGKTQLMLDSTIHAVAGKNEDRPLGLTEKQKAAQNTKNRVEDEKVSTRKAELL